MTTLTLVVPTINGREESRKRTLASYAAGTDRPYAVEIGHNYPTIGAAWVDILPHVTTDLAHLTTDDVTAESRWANEIRLEWEEKRGLAVPLMLRMPGEVPESHGYHGAVHMQRTEVGWVGVPVVPSCCYQSCVGALIEVGSPHYYSDNTICDVVRAHGHMLVALPRYRLGHWWEAGGADGSSFAREGAAWGAWRTTLEMPDQYAPLTTWQAWSAEHGIEQHT